MKLKLLTTLLLILFALPSFASDLPPCPSDSDSRDWSNCFGVEASVFGKYTGEYRNGKPHGQGTYIYGVGANKGDTYIGAHRNGVEHGNGTYTWADGAKHIGKFKNGKAHGNGLRVTPDGDKYQGEWQDGQPLILQEKSKAWYEW